MNSPNRIQWRFTLIILLWNDVCRVFTLNIFLSTIPRTVRVPSSVIKYGRRNQVKWLQDTWTSLWCTFRCTYLVEWNIYSMKMILISSFVHLLQTEVFESMWISLLKVDQNRWSRNTWYPWFRYISIGAK